MMNGKLAERPRSVTRCWCRIPLAGKGSGLAEQARLVANRKAVPASPAT